MYYKPVIHVRLWKFSLSMRLSRFFFSRTIFVSTDFFFLLSLIQTLSNILQWKLFDLNTRLVGMLLSSVCLFLFRLQLNCWVRAHFSLLLSLIYIKFSFICWALHCIKWTWVRTKMCGTSFIDGFSSTWVMPYLAHPFISKNEFFGVIY